MGGGGIHTQNKIFLSYPSYLILDAAELAGLPNVKFDNRYIEVVKHFNPPKEDE